MSTERSYDTEDLQLLTLFSDVTRTEPVDVVQTDDRLTFVVPEEQVGKAVGKGGANLKRLRQKIGKGIDVVAFDDDPAAFVKNIFRQFEASNVTVETRKDGTVIATVKVPPEQKGRAIGRNGKTVKTASQVAKRNVGVDSVVVE